MQSSPLASRPSEVQSQSQIEGVIDALQQDLEGSCEVERTQSFLVAPADLSMLAEAGCVPQPVEDSAGGSAFPQPHPAEAERGGPVRVQNRFSVLESTVRDTSDMSTAVDGSGVEVFPMTDDPAIEVLWKPRDGRPGGWS